MRITFLGTNGWYDTETGNTPCVFMETTNRYFIFDAGFGFRKAKDIIKDDRQVCLLISHLHLDHIIGLHTLPLFRMPQGIDIYAPAHIFKPLKEFLKRPFTSPPAALPAKIRFHSIDGNHGLPFELEMKRLRHSVPCWGYRINAEGKSIAYCTDTGDCANLRYLAREAELFITECAMAPGDRSPNLFHITPETAARIALEAGAHHLALFHFDPGKYPDLNHRLKAEEAARKIFESTVAANDGTDITI